MRLLRLIVSLIYAFAGVSGCVTFILFKNYPAAIFAISTGIAGIILSHIHYQNYKNNLQEWYTPQQLRQISWFGFFSFGLGTSALVYFSVIEALLKKPLLPIENSTVLPIVWTFMSLKCGLILFYYGRLYSRQEHTLLVEEPLEDTQSEEIAA